MKSNRRDFLKKLGLAGLALPSVSLFGGGLKKESEPFNRSHRQRFNMHGYAAPKLDTVWGGIIGLGNRGSGTVRRLASIVNKQLYHHTVLTLLSIFFFTFVFYQNAAATENGNERDTDRTHSSVHVDEMINDGAIQPYRDNPWYWEYRGEPIMLVGASDRDNLWQWTGERLIEQLNLIESVGGNYVRNTMSDRNEGDTFAAKLLPNGKYDLSQWNEEYWNKLRFFLDETQKRGIIVHLTLWDWFDLSGDNVYGRFTLHPLNPENNITWEPGTIESSRDYYGGSLQDNNEPVLEYQHRFIDKLISISSQYDHIIYNIANESRLGVDWENYWAQLIKKTAAEHGKSIHVTTMLFAPDTSVRRVMTYRNIYSFAEVSQNNQDALGPVGKKHWENLLYWRDMISASKEGPMPVNNVKVYGEGVGNNTAAGTQKEAIERMWRNVFGGAASTRFHRPAMRDDGRWGWGIGISEPAQQTLRAINMFLNEFDIFNAVPYKGCETVGNSVDSYCLANIGREYAVYFPSGGATVHLDPWVHMDRVSIKWLDIASLSWSSEEIIEPNWNDFDGTSWWGPQRILTLAPGNPLAPGNHRSYVAIIQVLD